MAGVEVQVEAGIQVAVEVCVEGVEAAIAAAQGGATRVELCTDLNAGGVTPSIGVVEACLDYLAPYDTAIHVLIRPRPGSFVYTSSEVAVMKLDIAAIGRLGVGKPMSPPRTTTDSSRMYANGGVHGVVIGALTSAYFINDEVLHELVALATSFGMTVTFHRAFDASIQDPKGALDVLIKAGVQRLLTSGREMTAWAGRDVIKELVQHAAGRIIILPGAGVTIGGAWELLQETGAKEVHAGSCCMESGKEGGSSGGGGSGSRGGGAKADAATIDWGDERKISAAKVRSLCEAVRKEPT